MDRFDLQRSAVCKIVTEPPILWRDCHSNQAINCVICLQAWCNCCSIVSPMPHAVSSRKKKLSQPVWNPTFYSFPPWHCFKIARHVNISNKNSELPAQNLARDPRTAHLTKMRWLNINNSGSHNLSSSHAELDVVQHCPMSDMIPTTVSNITPQSNNSNNSDEIFATKKAHPNHKEFWRNLSIWTPE